MESRMYQDFARLEDHHWWFTGRRAVVREVLRKRLSAERPRAILDVGCGTGGMLNMLKEFGAVEGLDASEEGLDLCRVRVGPEVALHRGQLPEGIPAGRRFDLITAFDVIEHIPAVVEALSAVRVALAKDGTLVCTVPAYQFLWSEHDVSNHHVRRYTRGLLKTHLQEAGFQVTFTSYFNSTLFSPIAAARLVQKLLPKRGGHSDFTEASPLVNRALEALFSAERFVVPRVSLPFGVSLLAIARPAE